MTSHIFARKIPEDTTDFFK